jgi:hypothetical protein
MLGCRCRAAANSGCAGLRALGVLPQQCAMVTCHCAPEENFADLTALLCFAACRHPSWPGVVPAEPDMEGSQLQQQQLRSSKRHFWPRAQPLQVCLSTHTAAAALVLWPMASKLCRPA